MEVESEHYPVGVPGELIVGIRAKRCKKCGKVFFTNNSDFSKCESCKDEV